MAESKRYVLWGSAGHAKVLDEAIRQRGDQVIALFDNSPSATSVLKNVELVGGIDDFYPWIKTIADRSNVYGLVAIGGARGQDRRVVQSLFSQHGLKIPPLVHPRAFVADTARLGRGSQVLAHALVAADADIGDACIINHKASIDHECRIADGAHVAPGATLCGCVMVDENVMIGAGSLILPRLKIGRDSIVGAGAVVTRDVPSGVVVVGNPAKVTRNVAMEHPN